MSGIKKNLVIFGCITTLILGASLFSTRFLNELEMQIPDKNGANKELCHFSDEDIENCYTDYRVIKRKVFNEECNTSGIQGRYEDCDSNYNHTALGKLSGIYILNAYLGTGATVQYTIESQVSAGNLRIVITNEHNQILYDVPIDEKATVSFDAAKDATYYVKLIGESAKVSLELWRRTVES